MWNQIKKAMKEWLWRYRSPVVVVGRIVTLIGIVAMALLTAHGRMPSRSSDLQSGIAREIIRFHVIANSDTREDQALKMRVKEQVVGYLSQTLADEKDIKETRETIKNDMTKIKRQAETVIQEAGYDYKVTATLTNCYFPMKSYGDCTFPAGQYEALRICIGEAKGKNWWCVLYPNLCFIDSIHAVVPEKEKQELKQVLTEEEYESLFDWKKHDYKIATKWF